MGSSRIRDQIHVSCIGRRIFFYHWTIREAQHIFLMLANFPIFVCSWVSQGCTAAAHWLTFSVLNHPDPGCLPGCCWLCSLQILSSGCTFITTAESSFSSMVVSHSGLHSSSPPHPITANSFTLNYSRYLLMWKLIWYWNFILVYIFLCVGKAWDHFQNLLRELSSFRRNKWTLDKAVCLWQKL